MHLPFRLLRLKHDQLGLGRGLGKVHEAGEARKPRQAAPPRLCADECERTAHLEVAAMPEPTSREQEMDEGFGREVPPRTRCDAPQPTGDSEEGHLLCIAIGQKVCGRGHGTSIQLSQHVARFEAVGHVRFVGGDAEGMADGEAIARMECRTEPGGESRRGGLVPVALRHSW